MKKLSIAVVIGILVGLLYGYEDPVYKYYKYENSASKEIRYEEYQSIKKDNEPGYYTPITRQESLNKTSVLIHGSIAFVIAFVLLSTLDKLESFLQRQKT